MAGAASQSAGSNARFQFGLRTLLLATTVIAVCLAVARLSIIGGVGLAIMAGPAFWRTRRDWCRRQAAGFPLTELQTCKLFCHSLLVMIFVAGTFVITLYVTVLVGLIVGAPVILLVRSNASAAVGSWVASLFVALLVLSAAFSLFVAIRVFRQMWSFDEPRGAASTRPVADNARSDLIPPA